MNRAAVLDQSPGLEPGDTDRLLRHQTAVMQLLADGAELGTVLGAVAVALEELMPGTLCSILLADADVTRLQHGAAPSLPEDYSRAVDGIEVGPDAGSCGTAAHQGAEVIAADILVDPRWHTFRAVAAPHGLRACWSTPIRGRSGIVGTFAVYHREPHRPDARERALVDHFTQLASLAIDHDRLSQERRARQAAEFARRAAEEARTAAEDASRAKSAFVAALSHELRTPMQAITGFTELLGTLDLTPERRQAALGHIQAATRHILALVDDVLDLARVEAGALPIRLADVPASEAVEEVLDLVQPLAEEGGVVLSCALRPVVVRADPRRLRQVLLNLVGNAIRYNRDGGRVLVTVDDTMAATGWAQVVVGDNGPGISEDLLQRLFVPFERLGADEGPERGVGLGLALSRSLSEAMGGELVLTSQAGQGTVVRVSLPVVSPPRG